MAGRQPDHLKPQHSYQYRDGYYSSAQAVNKNQHGRGATSPSGGEVKMDVDMGTMVQQPLPVLNKLLTALSSVEPLLGPAKQELESLSSKQQYESADAVKWKEIEATLKSTESERDMFQKANMAVTKEKTDLERKVRKYEESIEEIKDIFNTKAAELKQATENNESLAITLDSSKRDLDMVTKDNAALKQAKNEWMEKQRKTEVELSDAKSRLSKIMGQKLSDNNPNIADLSDQNRPTKLGERYQELYDNQWTDAFEALEKIDTDEKQCIKYLLDILKDVKQFCKEQCDKQTQQICGVIFLTQNTDRGSVCAYTKKQVKDFLKSTATSSVAEIQKSYVRRSKAIYMQDAQVRMFIDECVSICWLMSVQDPPVVLGKEPLPYSAFDTNFFKHYTKTGTEIDYVVWPSLYLYEGGPLLGKGVAQAKPSQGRQRSRGSSRDTRKREQEAQVNNEGNQHHGLRGQQAQAEARNDYDEPQNASNQANKGYLNPQNISKNASHSVPQQRDPVKSSTWDRSTADSGTSKDYSEMKHSEWLHSSTKTGAHTIAAQTGQMYPSLQQVDFAQSTRQPAAYQQITLVKKPIIAWQEYIPTKEDIGWFEFYHMYPQHYKEESMIKRYGQRWNDAFLIYKENKNNSSFSEV